jgi:transposase
MQQIIINNNYKYFAGIDLHKKYSYMTIVDQSGYIQEQGRFDHESNTSALIATLQKYGDQIQATMESSYGWYWMANELERVEIPFKLAHPKKINAIAGAKKTDKGDAKILADLLRIQLLPEAWVPNKQDRELKELLRFRSQVVLERSSIKRHLHDVLAKQNITCPYTNILGKKSQLWLKSLSCPQPYGIEIDLQLVQAELYETQIKTLDALVSNASVKNKTAQLLQTIPGIGTITALTLAVEIGDIHRFTNKRAFAAYAGVVPSVASSGDKTYMGRTGKRGNKHIRLCLMESLKHILNKDETINDFYEHICARKGKAKARVAVMNKLARIIYSMLKHQAPYYSSYLSNQQIPTLSATSSYQVLADG